MSGRPGSRLAIRGGLSILLPLILIVGIWAPPFAHYRVAAPRVERAAVAAARANPDGALLRELNALGPVYLVVRRAYDLVDPVAAADRILAGDVDLRGLPRTRITVPFSPSDVGRGGSSWQLSAASLTVPAVLLRAYAQTRDPRYLSAARDMILGWADYERRAWLPRGFLWNDHAVAARIPVLAEFWSAYRSQTSYDPAVAEAVLGFAARSAAFLADPRHFTVRTNHGIMQNLALWHYTLAFPTMSRTEEYREVALARLREQMGFYLDDEGVVLEHSPGYHRDGVEFIGLALRYLTLMNRPLPPDWVAKYQRAVQFYARLRLGNGELPLIGDTSFGPDPSGPALAAVSTDGRSGPLAPPAEWPAPSGSALYPTSGYAIWRSILSGPAGSLMQTTIAWSYFPGHGHKHADETSVLISADGTRWISNVGYWPYDVTGRARAESWDGSNAPHLTAEPAGSRRSTRLLAAAASDRLPALDLERRVAGGYVARRQIVQAFPEVLIVLDQTTGAPGQRSQTHWGFGPDIHLGAPGPPGIYHLEAARSSDRMILGLRASPGATVRPLRGSLEPFAGWQVIGSTPTPADALVVEHPADGAWSATVWCLDRAAAGGVPSCPDRAVTAEITARDAWHIALAGPGRSVDVSRVGPMIRAQRTPGGDLRTATLEPAADTATARASIETAYEQGVHRYPPFHDIAPYRLRATYAVLAILVAQEAALWTFPPARRRGRSLRLAAGGVWVALGLWLLLVYLR